MEAFGMIVLLGLAVLVVAGIMNRYIAVVHEFSAVVLIGLGIGTAYITDFDLFEAWGLSIRNHDIGLVFTGLVVAGAGHFWQPILSFFEGLTRKFTDEAQVLEKSQNLHRVA